MSVLLLRVEREPPIALAVGCFASWVGRKHAEQVVFCFQQQNRRVAGVDAAKIVPQRGVCRFGLGGQFHASRTAANDGERHARALLLRIRFPLGLLESPQHPASGYPSRPQSISVPAHWHFQPS